MISAVRMADCDHFGHVDRARRDGNAGIDLHAIARNGGDDPAVAPDIDIDRIFLARQILLQHHRAVLGLLVEVGTVVDLRDTARPGTLSGFGEARKRIDARGHCLGQRLVAGNRHLALDGLDQELLVAADPQAFDGRDRQRNADRFETVPRRRHRRQLGVDGRQQGRDAPFRASAMERWNQLRCVAARNDQTPFRRHEIEAGGQRVDVGHVQLVLGRQALPDADGCGAARAGDQDAHASPHRPMLPAVDAPRGCSCCYSSGGSNPISLSRWRTMRRGSAST